MAFIISSQAQRYLLRSQRILYSYPTLSTASYHTNHINQPTSPSTKPRTLSTQLCHSTFRSFHNMSPQLKIQPMYWASLFSQHPLMNISHVYNTHQSQQVKLHNAHWLLPPHSQFSALTRRVAAKKINSRKKKKYKMKTNKAAARRVWVTGGRRDQQFRFKMTGARHLMRKKTKANLLKKRRARKSISTKGDLQRMKRLLPYFKSKKYY